MKYKEIFSLSEEQILLLIEGMNSGLRGPKPGLIYGIHKEGPADNPFTYAFQSMGKVQLDVREDALPADRIMLTQDGCSRTDGSPIFVGYDPSDILSMSKWGGGHTALLQRGPWVGAWSLAASRLEDGSWEIVIEGDSQDSFYAQKARELLGVTV